MLQKLWCLLRDRYRHESQYEHVEGRLFDNTATPGAKGWSASPGATPGLTAPQIRAQTRGPNVEPYLATAEDVRVDRHFSPYRHETPEVAVREPTGVQPFGTVYNAPRMVASAPAQINTVVPVTEQVSGLAPTQIRQREKEPGTPSTPWDAGDTVTLRTPQAYTPSQQYFNERTPLPEFTTPSVPSHAVICGGNGYFPATLQRGWTQAFVPEPGERMNMIGVAHPTLQSRPILVKTVVPTDAHRTPMKTKSPKRKKGATS